ncbi:MAG: WG repeat-containing protein, partial [Polyangia bacterium]
VKDSKAGYIDRTGSVVIKPKFNGASDYSQGLARVHVGDKWSFIDKEGKFITDKRFAEARDFSEGLAAVMIKSKWGYLGQDGRILIAPQFDMASPFSEGLAAVQRSEKWGYIDSSGRTKIEPQFGGAGDFSGGLAQVVIGPSERTSSFRQTIYKKDSVVEVIPRQPTRSRYVDTKGKLIGGDDSADTTTDSAIPSEPIIKGEYDKSALMEVIKSKAGAAIRLCYSRASSRKPSLAGTMVIDWVITGAGTVANVEILKDSIGDASAALCMSNAVGQLRFPPPAGASVKISYPFVFPSPGH